MRSSSALRTASVTTLTGHWAASPWALAPRSPDHDGDAARSSRTGSDAVERVLRTSSALAVTAALVQGVVHLIDVLAFDLSIGLLNADYDESVFGWSGTAVQAMAGWILCLLTVFARRHAVALGALTCAVWFLSLDDFVQFHERLSALVPRIGPVAHASRAAWPMMLFPLLAVVFVLLWRVALAAPPRCAGLIRIGMGLLVLAVALEFLSPGLFALGFDHGDLAYEVEVVVEEGAELAGWALITGGLSALLCLVAATSAGRQT